MVSGELLISLGFGKITGRLFGSPFEKVFNISRNGAAAYFAGAFCGLPIGGKYAIELYKNGDISKNDCEKLMAISNNAGIGFVVLGVGQAIWNDTTLGWYIYITQLLASLVVGTLFFRATNVEPNRHESFYQTQRKPFHSVLSGAITKSAVNMLSVCAFVVFFSTLCQTVLLILSPLGNLCANIVCVFSEISSGCVYAHDFSLSSSPAALIIGKSMTFSSVGFSGFCVLMQLRSFADGSDISFKKYLVIKLLIGSFCAIAGAMLSYLSLI